MPLSSFELAMQAMGSILSDYLEENKSVPVISKDGLNQLVKEQFPHCKKKEIRPGVYRIRIPPTETSPGYSPLEFQEVPRLPQEDVFFQINLFADFLEMEFLSYLETRITPDNQVS